ncbi:hypothetical protein M8J75_009782 [Diaphorina citri]|nr:hypothetical protein M8J75_009782 [Diaphorina citri]
MPALERSTSGALALHYASARGCLDCVKLLVETSLELRSFTFHRPMIQIPKPPIFSKKFGQVLWQTRCDVIGHPGH